MRTPAKTDSGAMLGLSRDQLHLLLYSHDAQMLHRFSFTLRSAGTITLCPDYQRLPHASRARSFDALLLSAEIARQPLDGFRVSALPAKTPVLLVASEATFRPSAFFAHIDGIIEPTITLADLREALLRAKTGHFIAPGWFNRCLAEIMRLSYIGYRRDFIAELHLTPVEVKVIDFIAEHLENKEIVDKLSISEALVRKIIASAYAKLHVRRRTQAAVFWSKLLD